MNPPLSPRALRTRRRQKSGHNGQWSNCSCCACTTSVWSSPCDTGYVLMLHIHRLKSSNDINKKKLTISSNYDLLYTYLNYCPWVQADYLPHGPEWCLIGLHVGYLRMSWRATRRTWSWRTTSCDLHQPMPLAQIPCLLSPLPLSLWTDTEGLQTASQLISSAHHWPMITLLVSPKGKTHKGSVSLWNWQMAFSSPCCCWSRCLSYCTCQQEIYSSRFLFNVSFCQGGYLRLWQGVNVQENNTGSNRKSWPNLTALISWWDTNVNNRLQYPHPYLTPPPSLSPVSTNQSLINYVQSLSGGSQSVMG